MKTLLLVSISLFTVNVMASTSNFNCAAQKSSDRNQSICGSSLVSDSVKLKHQCISQVKTEKERNKIVR